MSSERSQAGNRDTVSGLVSVFNSFGFKGTLNFFEFGEVRTGGLVLGCGREEFSGPYRRCSVRGSVSWIAWGLEVWRSNPRRHGLCTFSRESVRDLSEM